MGIYINKIISVIFHPIFTPILIFNIGLIIGYNDSLFNHFNWLIILLFFTIICPILMLIFFKKNNLIYSFEMNTHKERVVPLLSSILFILIGFYFLELAKVPIYLLLIYLGGVVLLFIVSIVSYFYKISIHLAGIGSLYGAVLFFSILYNVPNISYLIIILIMAIVVSIARFNLNAHTINQLLIGFSLGISVIVSFLLIL